MKTQNIFASLLQRFLLAAHPVGSLYWSQDSTSPDTLFGGTWARITDTFIVAAGSQYPAGTSGGAPSINLQHTHATANHTLTVAEMPSHTHTNSAWHQAPFVGGGTSTSANISTGGGSYSQVYLNAAGGSGAHNHGNTGNALSSAQSIIPPYESYYCWRRTA